MVQEHYKRTSGEKCYRCLKCVPFSMGVKDVGINQNISHRNHGSLTFDLFDFRETSKWCLHRADCLQYERSLCKTEGHSESTVNMRGMLTQQRTDSGYPSVFIHLQCLNYLICSLACIKSLRVYFHPGHLFP